MGKLKTDNKREFEAHLDHLDWQVYGSWVTGDTSPATASWMSRTDMRFCLVQETWAC